MPKSLVLEPDVIAYMDEIEVAIKDRFPEVVTNPYYFEYDPRVYACFASCSGDCVGGCGGGCSGSCYGSCSGDCAGTRR